MITAVLLALTPYINITAQIVANNITVARVSVTNSLPLTGSYYSGPSPTVTYNLVFKYNAAGQLVSKHFKDVLSNELIYKDSIAYDINGNQTFKATYNRSGSSLVLNTGTKYLISYNTAGKKTEEITQEYNNIWRNKSKLTWVYNAAGILTEKTSYNWANNSWENFEKFTAIYDSNGRIIEEIQCNGSVNIWNNYKKIVFNYTGTIAQPHEILFYNYQSSVWVLTIKAINISWKSFGNWQPQLLNYFINLVYLPQYWETTNIESQYWDTATNTWVNFGKLQTTYDSYGGSVKIEQDWNNNMWVNYKRYSNGYDSHFNYTGLQEEQWNNNSWERVIHPWYQHTYNSTGDLIEIAYKQWNYSSQAYSTYWRETYSNFISINGVNSKFRDQTVNVYPNPTSDILIIKLKNQSSGEIQLTDLTGRIVKTETLSTANTRIDISALPKGIYLLNIQTEKGSHTSKVVKQ